VPSAGTTVLRLIWHYADGTERETAVNYGEHLRNWWTISDPKSEVTAGRVAWTGSNPAAADHGSQSVFITTLENPRPEVRSRAWNGSVPEHRCPFIVAMTVE
jgi:hypothetical protein